jgi:hypothetical protein
MKHGMLIPKHECTFGTNVNSSKFLKKFYFLKGWKHIREGGGGKIIVTLYYFSRVPCLTSNIVIIMRIFTIFLDQNAFKGATNMTLH